MRRYNQGWKAESERHSLAARGVKTKANFDRMPWWRKWASTDYFRQQMAEMNEDTQAGMRQALAEEKKAEREKLKGHTLAAKGKKASGISYDKKKIIKWSYPRHKEELSGLNITQLKSEVVALNQWSKKHDGLSLRDYGYLLAVEKELKFRSASI